MKLSVIMPCLNADATIAVQLDALALQQWSQPWELIVSDNGSTDRSVDIANSYSDRFDSLRVIHAPGRKTSSHPRNVAARAATSDNLAFCDADDEVAPGWVAAMGDALASHDVVHGRILFDKFNEADYAARAAQGWKDGLYTGRFLPGASSGNCGIKRWIHEAIGGFDESLPRFVDSDYFWRLQLEGFKLHYVPDAILQYRIARVNPSLSSIYHRHRKGMLAEYWSYQRYRHLGILPPAHLKSLLVSWFCVLKCSASRDLLIKQKRDAWYEQFFMRSGELVGHLQGKITAPRKPFHPGEVCQPGPHVKSLK